MLLFYCMAIPCLLGFSQSNSFPKPLTKDEEAHYLTLYEEGSEKEKKEAKDKLILHNLRLVAHISKKYNLTIKDQEEGLSIGTIGLIKGIESFNSKKNVRLASYAAKCIQNELLMWLRSTKKIRNDISLYEPIGTDKDGNEMAIIDVISDRFVDFADTLDLSMQTKKLYGCLKDVLSQREYTVIILRYGLFDYDSITQQEIADLLKISRSYVSRIEKKAIKKLATYFNTNPNEKMLDL
ncbi:MAG: RNA polymerase sporulation sigma factor SigK [Bacillota bacterium]